MPVKRFTNTKKQREIMNLIVAASARGETMTVPLLKAQLSYGAGVSNQAITGSLEMLAKHGFLKKTLKGPHAMLIEPTALAFRTYRPIVLPEPF
jgi:hypothetical protein